ncbi:MAG: NAD(P)-binding domain-containing protein [Solirubrobacteraceae bacterium]
MGAGHAGLATSHCLAEHGIEHVVLERGRVAERWRSERWDSLTLLTPNWATWLPGYTYTGDEPDGYMGRDEVAGYLDAYAAAFDPPLRTGVDVRGVTRHDGGYRLRTSDGELEVAAVVLATGPFQLPRVPALAAGLPDDVTQVHSSAYRNATQLPPGGVLVVGGGASGQQIAEDLLRAGRAVHLSVGRLRAVPRRYRGRDYFWWLENTGFYDATVDTLAGGRPPKMPSPSLTGVNGGHDLSARTLAAQGATVVGRLAAVDGGRLLFADDLAGSLARGDEAFARFVERVEGWLADHGEQADAPEHRPALPDPPAASDGQFQVDLVTAGIASIIWATGFQPSFEWVHVPILDDRGAPVHHRGITASRGLYVLGLPWLHRQRSAFIRGAEEDARHIAAHLATVLSA